MGESPRRGSRQALLRLHSYSSPMSEFEGGPGRGRLPSYFRRTMPEF